MKRETISISPHGFKVIGTPWGNAQTSTEYGPGVTFYTTAGHGGFQLSPEALTKMPHPLAHVGTFAGPGWYEEDCDWSVVAISFPEMFSDAELFSAVETIMGGSRPAYMDGVDAWLESPAAKPVRDRCDAFYAENKGKFRLAGCHTGGDLWHCRAATLDRERVLMFTIKEYTSFDAPFTREDVEQLGGTVLRDALKSELKAS